MVAKEPNDARFAAIGGVVSGIVAALALTWMMTTMSLAREADPWFGIKGAAAPLLGERALGPGFDPVAVPLGLAVHVLISVAWAVPFAMFTFRLSRAKTLLAGAGWGIVVWLGMYYVVLPLVGLGWMTTQAPIARAILYHVFFGLFVAGAYLGYQRLEGSTLAAAKRRPPLEAAT